MIGAGAGSELIGLNFGGIGLGAGKNMKGVSIGLVGAGAGDDAIGINIGGLGLGAGNNMIGINIGGLGVGAGDKIMGVTIAGIGAGAGDRLTGLTVCGLAAGAPTIKGLTVAGLALGGKNITGLSIALGSIQVRADKGDGEYNGLAVSAFNFIKGTMKGVAVGIVNYAYRLKGLQIGLVNIVRDNPRGERSCPSSTSIFSCAGKNNLPRRPSLPLTWCLRVRPTLFCLSPGFSSCALVTCRRDAFSFFSPLKTRTCRCACPGGSNGRGSSRAARRRPD